MHTVQNSETTRFLLAATLLAVGLCGCQIPKRAALEPQYVQVREIDGKWWFVRGDDRFIERGCNVVAPVDGTPAEKGPRYNVLPKYNNDEAAWARDAADRLRAWNFNTAAGWSHECIYTNVPIYHTRVIWLGPWGNRDSRLIDVFSSGYSQAVYRLAAREVSPHASNEYLIGWFANNELPWYGEKGWPSDPDVSILSRYMRLPPKAPGKSKAVEFLKERYQGDFEAFAKNWDTPADSFDELLKYRTIKPRIRESKKDAIAWSGVVADQYFRLCSDALRKYDPNHLFLGVRFAERAYEPIMEACGRYADVVSVNHYRKNGMLDTKKLGAISALAKKPIMITEFSWRAMENSSGCPNALGADVTVPTQQDRADRFRTYATNLLAQPYIVGYDWFMYHDQPPNGRFDGENSNYGLVDINDNFYTTLLGTITEINGRAHELRLLSDTPMPTYDPAILADYKDITVRDADKPLEKPVVIIDSSSTFEGWGDFPRGAEIAAEKTDQDTVKITVKPGKGWGCGVTFQPVESLPKNPDGSVSVTGASKAVVRLSAPAGAKFSLGIQESGHGGLDAQNYSGHGNADGESYVSRDIPAGDGMQDYVFDPTQMEPSSAYGNQRGNFTVDTDAISQCHIYFAGKQREFEVELESVRFE